MSRGINALKEAPGALVFSVVSFFVIQQLLYWDDSMEAPFSTEADAIARERALLGANPAPEVNVAAVEQQGIKELELDLREDKLVADIYASGFEMTDWRDVLFALGFGSTVYAGARIGGMPRLIK